MSLHIPRMAKGTHKCQNLSLYTLNAHSLKKEREVAQSSPTLCNPMDCSLPGFSIRGIFQARVLEWVAISFSRGSSPPRDRTQVSALQTDALPSEPPGKPYMQLAAAAKSLQSCPTLCNPMDCSLPGSSAHGIFQARVLEWVAISFSKEAPLLVFIWRFCARHSLFLTNLIFKM